MMGKDTLRSSQSVMSCKYEPYPFEQQGNVVVVVFSGFDSWQILGSVPLVLGCVLHAGQ